MDEEADAEDTFEGRRESDAEFESLRVEMRGERGANSRQSDPGREGRAEGFVIDIFSLSSEPEVAAVE